MDLTPPSVLWILPLAAAAVPLILKPGSKGASLSVASKHSSPMAKAVAAASQLAFTAGQDGNDMLALMHITEAVATLDTVRTLTPDHEIARTCGVDAHAMAADLDATRRRVVARLSAADDADETDDE